MKTKDGGPAFPVADLSKTQCTGMTLRDYFAGQAMSICAQFPVRSDFATCSQQAAYCYQLADAMLAARQKQD